MNLLFEMEIFIDGGFHNACSLSNVILRNPKLVRYPELIIAVERDIIAIFLGL